MFSWWIVFYSEITFLVLFLSCHACMKCLFGLSGTTAPLLEEGAQKTWRVIWSGACVRASERARKHARKVENNSAFVLVSTTSTFISYQNCCCCHSTSCAVCSTLIMMYLPRGLALNVVLYVVDIQRLLLCWRMLGADSDSRMGGRFRDGLFLHTK